MRSSTLIVALLALWMLLSGIFEPWLLSLGVLSAALVTWISSRMGLLQGAPPHLHKRRVITYLPWLVWEVAKSNVQVARVILDPRHPVQPTVVNLPPAPRGDAGRALYANSITLTPGTVTLAIDDGGLRVHALTREAAADLQRGEMGRRVAALESQR